MLDVLTRFSTAIANHAPRLGLVQPGHWDRLGDRRKSWVSGASAGGAGAAATLSAGHKQLGTQHLGGAPHNWPRLDDVPPAATRAQPILFLELLARVASTAVSAGSAPVGKIANKAAPVNASKQMRSERRRACVLMLAASVICSDAAVVPSITSRSRSLLTKPTLSRSTCALSSLGITGLLISIVAMLALSTPTESAPAIAVPTAPARLLVVPRSEAISPASTSGVAAASTLNRTVTSAPCPRPTTTSAMITIRVYHSLCMTAANNVSPAATKTNAPRAMWRELRRSNRRETKTAAAKIDSELGIIASAVRRLL